MTRTEATIYWVASLRINEAWTDRSRLRKEGGDPTMPAKKKKTTAKKATKKKK